MDIKKIKETLVGEPAFRMKQVYKAVFADFFSSWEEVSVLPIALRQKLDQEAPLDIAMKIIDSQDEKSAKALLDLRDVKIESVLMRHKDGRNTVCVSTQAGCKMACDFCLTGKMGFKRSLSSEEIILQVLAFSRYLKKFGEKVTNVVFMGMGEPFDNYEEVMKAVRFLNDPETFNIGARRISISTVGVIEGIKKLASDPLQVNLAVSLHASNDELRDKIMPISKTYPLEALFRAIANYINKTNRKVMIEYVMLAGVNDKDELAKELAETLKKELYNLFVVNLISYNQTGKYKASDRKQIDSFKNILESQGVEVIERYRFGRDIKAACGQLANQ